MNKSSKILIIGHGDIIDQSLFKYFESHGFLQVFSNVKMGLNTTIQSSVYEFFSRQRPDYVFLASTRSGGIGINQQAPAEFIYHNLESQNNVVYAAQKFGVKKLMYFGSSCTYPIDCPQPIKEKYFLKGELEATSEAYAVAKIAGTRLCQAFKKQYGFNAISIIPATVYGPGCDVDLATAHVMGALISKFVSAVEKKENEVVVWGTGEPKREFLYVDDFIEACLFLTEKYNDADVINVGYGSDISIKELAQLIADIVGFKGNIVYDSSKPDGVRRKLLDSSHINDLGWKAKISLKEGIEKTVNWYRKGLKG